MEYAHHLLSRLPARPPNVLESLTSNVLDVSKLDEYFIQQADGNSASNCTSKSCWDDLQVVAAVDTTILRIALGMAWSSLRVNRRSLYDGMEFVNAVAGLLSLAFRLFDEFTTPDAKRSWVVVKAFLWTVWQRALMLHFWELMES